jgi:hypothetical protein
MTALQLEARWDGLIAEPAELERFLDNVENGGRRFVRRFE